MPQKQTFSDGSSYVGRLIVDSDNHAERSGLWNSFWANVGVDGTIIGQVTTVGYCSYTPDRTRVGAAARARLMFPGEVVYRVTPSGKLGAPIK